MWNLSFLKNRTAHQSLFYSEENYNYWRMHWLLTLITPRAVRVLFDTEIPPSCLQTYIMNASEKLVRLKRQRVISADQWNLLFPNYPGRIDSNSFDSTLMVALIRELTNLPQPTGGYDHLPMREETTPAADLARIKYYSDMFLKKDITDREIESPFFTTVWRDITGAIGRLGGPEMIMECEELKTIYVNHTRYQQSYKKGVDKQPALSATGPSLERLTSFQHVGKVKDSLTVFPLHSPIIQIDSSSRKISNLDHQEILNDSSSEEDLHGSGLFSPYVKARSLKPFSLFPSAYVPEDGDINEDKEIVSSGLDSFDEKEKEKYETENALMLNETISMKLRSRTLKEQPERQNTWLKELWKLEAAIDDIAGKGKKGDKKEKEKKSQKKTDTGVLLTAVIECDGYVIDCDVPRGLPSSKRFYKNAAKGVLLTAVIECDGHVIDCDVPRDLPSSKRFYKNATKDKPQLKVTKAFQKLLSFHKEGSKYTDMNTEFENSILLDESMVCRYILANFKNLFNDKYTLQKVLRLAMENGKPKCAKAIAWEICKRYAMTVSIIQYYDIWPGFKCSCSTQKTSDDIFFCSCNAVIVAEVHKMEKLSPKREAFNGIPIVYKEVNGRSKEAMSVMEKIDSTIDAARSYESCQNVSAENATKYFAKHSKLTMISKSHLKSKGFGEENQKFERVTCIQFFCRAKRIIPIGEAHFPYKIASVQTDIFEGYPRLQAKQIRIGTEFFVPTEEQNKSDNGQNASVIPEYEEMDIDIDVNRPFKGKAGTIGGFLKFHGEDAFLTCAHVILSPDFLISHTFGSELHENPVKIYCKDENGLRGVIPCGHLASFTFPPNEINGISIDAAIIKIDQNHAKIHMDDAEKRELKSNYLQKCCLDWQEVGVHTDFEVRTFGAVSLDQHIKDKAEIIEGKHLEFETLYQAVANVYRDINPANVQDNIHFAVQALDIVSKRHFDRPGSVLFRNQIAMHKIKFQQGDSGMCIYVRHNDGLFWCIGMAIATHPAGGCIITPLKAILRHFNY